MPPHPLSADEYIALPLLRLSPYNLPDEGRLHMAVKVYYDGSGDATHPQQRFLTLAGIAAPETVWPHFEAAWKAMLEKNHAPYLHMRELMAREEPFEGWSKRQCHTFVIDAMNVLGQFVQGKLRVYSCCVMLDGYRRAREEITALREKAVEALCVDYCVYGLQFAHEEFDVPRPIILYFDHNERFLRHIDRAWRDKEGARAQRNRYGWPYQIAAIVPADMKSVYPLQAADLIAWHMNRHYDSVTQTPMTHEEALYQTFFLLNHRTWYFDYGRLKKAYAEQEGE